MQIITQQNHKENGARYGCINNHQSEKVVADIVDVIAVPDHIGREYTTDGDSNLCTQDRNGASRRHFFGSEPGRCKLRRNTQHENLAYGTYKLTD
jgi:hypothetical protein